MIGKLFGIIGNDGIFPRYLFEKEIAELGKAGQLEQNANVSET